MTAPDRYAVVGHPVAHSRSPFIHAAFARQTDQNLVYEALDVPPVIFSERIVEFFASGGRGLNITVPHKQAAFLLADSLTERARRAGAVNLLMPGAHGLLGDNTDGAGLVRDLLVNLKHDPRGQRVLILGAGGAARGVVAPLLECGPAEIAIANRTQARACELVADFVAEDASIASVLRASTIAELSGTFDLIINATSASLSGDLPPLDAKRLNASTLCYDMAYGKEPTVFVKWSAAQGARAEAGLGMLVEQAAEAFYLWRDVRPETAPVLGALRKEIG